MYNRITKGVDYVAVEVTVKSKGLFKRSLKFTDIIDNDMRYGIMDEAFRLEEGTIGENTVIFKDKNICRGYEMSINKGEVNLRMPLPTSTSDINFFYEYIKKICTKMNAKTFTRDNEVLSLGDIENCIKLDIEASEAALKKIEENINNGTYENMYIFGAVNPVALGKKEMENIKGDTTKFGILMNSLQGMDVYYAKASIYQRKDKSYFGVYVLTAEVASVLPEKPALLMNENNLKVDDWNIGFVVNEKLEGFISYKDFLKNITKDSEYDAEHFVITLDKNKMKELLEKYKVEL